MRRWLAIPMLAGLAVCMPILCASTANADRLEIVAGGGSAAEGPALTCKLDRPFSSGMDTRGTLFVAEYSGRVIAIDPSGRLRRVAGGNGEGNGGDGGPAALARLNAPHHLLVLPDGDILVADTMNYRIRRIEAKTGNIVPFAGTGVAGFSGDGGPARDAMFGGIYCLAYDAKRKLLYADDLDSRRIRRIDLRTGIVSTVAGNGRRGVPADGSLAVESPLEDPRAIACDSHGSIYILERGGNALRVVDERGRIRTVVGTGHAGPAHDGLARSAALADPKNIAVDNADDVLIADTDNHTIRKYLVRTGQIVNLVGNGTAGAGHIGGDVGDAQLNQPHGVYVDKSGNIIICDSWNDRVLRLVRERP